MGGVRGSKYTYIVNSVLQGLWEMRRTFPASKGSSLRTAYVWLMQQHGLGTFMAQEIVADLKYQSAWRNASDWWTFAAPGRGSFQGTAYLMNRPQKRSLESSRRGVETRITTRMNEEEWRSILAYVQKWINARLVRRRLEPLHAQDVQGALCEFARYERIRRGEGFTRRYTPAHSQTEVS